MPITPIIKAKSRSCFVCSEIASVEQLEINPKVNMFVCKKCKGSEAEKLKVQDYLNDLGSGFTVGCIS